MNTTHPSNGSDGDAPVTAYQERVAEWLHRCFGERIARDAMERNHRFLEEALELVQACGCSAEEAHQLVDYVFNRPVGEKSQEVGGVMVTLAALCHAQDLSMHASGEQELARITLPEIIERIRVKQSKKPSMSPLPGVYPERAFLGTGASWRLIAEEKPVVGQPIAIARKGMPPFAGVYDLLDGAHRCIDRVSGTWWEFTQWIALPENAVT